MIDPREQSLRGEALEAVTNAFRELLSEERERGNAIEVDPSLVADVFNAAWSHQFDETPAALRREVKALLKQETEEPT